MKHQTTEAIPYENRPNKLLLSVCSGVPGKPCGIIYDVKFAVNGGLSHGFCPKCLEDYKKLYGLKTNREAE